MAHLYGFQELEASISEYLKAVLRVMAVCWRRISREEDSHGGGSPGRRISREEDLQLAILSTAALAFCSLILCIPDVHFIVLTVRVEYAP